MTGKKRMDTDQAVRAAMKADKAAVDAVTPPDPDHPAAKALFAWGKMGDQPPLRILCGAMLALGLARRDARMASAAARMFVSHSIATVAKDILKNRIDRKRPHEAEGRVAPLIRAGRSTAKAKTSFPSGHSAGAIAVARAFAQDYPEHGLAATGAAASVALAQIPRCNHYPTDIAAGLAVGAVSAGLVNALWNRAEERLV